MLSLHLPVWTRLLLRRKQMKCLLGGVCEDMKTKRLVHIYEVEADASEVSMRIRSDVKCGTRLRKWSKSFRKNKNEEEIMLNFSFILLVEHIDTKRQEKLENVEKEEFLLSREEILVFIQLSSSSLYDELEP